MRIGGGVGVGVVIGGGGGGGGGGGACSGGGGGGSSSSSGGGDVSRRRRGSSVLLLIAANVLLGGALPNSLSQWLGGALRAAAAVPSFSEYDAVQYKKKAPPPAVAPPVGGTSLAPEEGLREVLAALKALEPLVASGDFEAAQSLPPPALLLY